MLVTDVPQALCSWSHMKEEFVIKNPCNSWTAKQRLIKGPRAISNQIHLLELTYPNCTSVLLKSAVNLWDNCCCLGGLHSTVGSREKKKDRNYYSLHLNTAVWTELTVFFALPLLSRFVQKFCSLLYLEKRGTKALGLKFTKGQPVQGQPEMSF